MKIGLLLDSTLDSTDGVQQFVLQIGGYMTKQGHEVHYIVGETTRTDMPRLHSMTKNIKVGFNGNVISSPLPVSRRRIASLLDELNVDIIHVQTPYSPFFAAKMLSLAKKRHIPVVSTFHILPLGKVATAGNALLGLLLRVHNSAIVTTVAVSPPAALFAQKYYGRQCRVIPNPIALASFSSKQRTNTVPTVVFLGRLVERKGSMKLLQAIDHLRRHGLYDGDFRVELGGKGELADELAAYVVRHDLQDFVTLHGFVAETDKKDFLSQADIAVFPSTGGESFGISLLEAFAACQGVVLAGNNPGYASVVPDKRNLIEPSDTPAFAHTIAKWLNATSERQQMSALQKDHVRSFDIGVVGAKYETVYKQALQTSKQS